MGIEFTARRKQPKLPLARAGGRVLSGMKSATNPGITLTASPGGRTALLSERHRYCRYTAVDYREHNSGIMKGTTQSAIAD